MTEPTETPLKRTALHEIHVELGAKMVPFAGYDMPVQYPGGILQEHVHTRTMASLFDVSHMGQVIVRGGDPVAAIETLVPGDIAGLERGRMRYTMLTNDRGGILDDLIVSRYDDGVLIVVNAACKEGDIAHIAGSLPAGHSVEYLEDRSLLALQGPLAALTMARLAPGSERLRFMQLSAFEIVGVPVTVSRSGYTGEDGFEISVASSHAADVARALLAQPDVAPAGLGARDSLRLEAGLCLYGHDIDTTTTPVEAGLAWSIGKRRRTEGGFPGADIIRDQLSNGVARRRVGLVPDERAPAREGTDIIDSDGNAIGKVTSGGFGPTVGGPVSMGYLKTSFAKDGTAVGLVVRGKARPAHVRKMPFVQHHYMNA